jgi:hypothetical protein
MSIELSKNSQIVELVLNKIDSKYGFDATEYASMASLREDEQNQIRCAIPANSVTFVASVGVGCNVEVCELLMVFA